MIARLFWRLVAAAVSWPPVTRYLVRRAKRTPYFHLVKNGRTYMERYWLFNPYDNASRRSRWAWCPISVRIHIIRRPDDDAHLHDHPWDARTIILDGWHLEERHGVRYLTTRRVGDTAPIGVGLFHRITEVSSRGAVTLFISGRYRGTWGYLVNGRKVPWREYHDITEGAES